MKLRLILAGMFFVLIVGSFLIFLSRQPKETVPLVELSQSSVVSEASSTTASFSKFSFNDNASVDEEDESSESVKQVLSTEERDRLFKTVKTNVSSILALMFDRLSGGLNPVVVKPGSGRDRFGVTSDIFHYVVEPFENKEYGYLEDVSYDLLLYLNRTLPADGFLTANGDNVRDAESQIMYGPIVGDVYKLNGSVNVEDVSREYPDKGDIAVKVTFSYEAGQFTGYDNEYVMYFNRDAKLVAVQPLKNTIKGVRKP